MFSKSRKKKDILKKTSPDSLNESESFFEGLDLSKLKQLLARKTHEAHQEAFSLLQKHGLTAFQRWESIHSDPALKHPFSKVSPELVNDFAHMVLVYLNDQSNVLELGCGYGNDALFIATKTGAKVIGVDASKTAIAEAKKRAKKEGADVAFICKDYVQVLKKIQKSTLDMVYCYSGANYLPESIFEESLLPIVANALKPSGVFCLAMKTSDSTSLKAPSQIILNPVPLEAPFLYTLNKKESLFSMHPKSRASLVGVLKKNFNLIYEEEVEVEAYDHPGDTEVFICVIARPKK